ncbi:MAG: HD domain-containing protein [Gemmatimonadaceae bacterium]
MPITGYSDRINHALAFAAKHHDQQVRKGTRAPYLTQPANVALILTRYGQEDETIVAGILHDVIADCVTAGFSRETLERRVGDKFGAGVLDTALDVTHRKVDDDGVDLSASDRRVDYLERLERASDRAKWVCAADKLHNAATIVADLRRTVDPESVWSRFAAGKEATVRWYRSVYDRLFSLGFRAPIMDELGAVVAQLEELEAKP